MKLSTVVLKPNVAKDMVKMAKLLRDKRKEYVTITLEATAYDYNGSGSAALEFRAYTESAGWHTFDDWGELVAWVRRKLDA